MKKSMRVIIPLMIVSVLVLLSAGLAFAREVGFVQNSENSQNTKNMLDIVYESIFPSKFSTKSLLPASTNLEGRTGQAGSSNQSLLPQSSEANISISVTNTITSTLSDEMELIGVVEAIAPDKWTVAGETFAVTPETEIEGNIVLGDMVKVELHLSNTNVLTASQIELLHEDEHGETFEFTGTVTALTQGSVTVGTTVLVITEKTEIEGTLALGAVVKVEALVNTDGTFTATQIEVKDDTGDGDESHDGDCDDDDCGNNQGGDDNHQGECHEDCGENHDGEHDGYHDNHDFDDGDD